MNTWSRKRQLKGIAALVLSVAIAMPQNIAILAAESDFEENIADELTFEENIADEPTFDEIIEEDNDNAGELLEDNLLVNEGDIADTAYVENMSAEDEEARKTDGEARNYNSKLGQYLMLKYKTQWDTDHDGTVSESELNSAYNTYSGTLEIYGPNATATGDSEALKDIAHNMVQYNALGSFENVEEIVIDGVDEIRDIYFPVSLKKLTIKNSTLNISQGSGFYHYGYSYPTCAGLFNCPNLEELTFENDTLGTMYLRQNIPYWTFLDQLTLPLYNNTNLRKLDVSINFVNDEQKLVINAGENAFPYLTENNCNIVTSGDGRLIVDSSNADSVFSKKYKVVEGVEFESRLFREMIIGDANADEDGDGILTQGELNKIESLTIDNDHLINTWPNLDTCTNFNDLEKLQGLKELTIQHDYSDHTARRINAIKFPASLEKLTIINTRVKFTDSQIPSVKTLVLRNVQPLDVSESSVLNLTVNDTGGNLETVCLDNSGISSLTVINGGTKRNLTFSAEEAEKLSKVEFQGAFYTLVGENIFIGCTGLQSIGYKNAETNKWMLDCSAGDSDFYLDLTNCTSLAGNSNSMVISCDVPTTDKKAEISLYSTTDLFDDRLTINRTGAGTVKLLVDNDTNLSKWETKYTGENGVTVSAVSSDPDIVVFELGNLLNLDTEEYVDRWNIVVQQGINFRNHYKYYVVKNGKARRVTKLPAGKSVRFEIENPENKTVIKFHSSDAEPYDIDAVDDGIGKLSVKLINSNDGSVIKDIGYVRIRVTKPTTCVTPKVISPIDSSYTLLSEDNSEDNPIYVEGNGRIAFKASMEPGDDITFQDALWILNDDAPKLSHIYTASTQGIKVSSEADYSASLASALSDEQIKNCKTDRTIREFYFPDSLKGNERKIKLTAQAPIKYNDWAVNKSWYIEIKDPCAVSLSNKGKMIYGYSEMEAVTINISEFKNKDTVSVSIKDIEKYKDCISLSETSKDNSSIKYEVKVNKDKPDSVIRSVFHDNMGIVLQVKADYGYQEKTIYFKSVDPSPNDPETNNGWGEIIDEDKIFLDPTELTENSISVMGINDVTYTGAAQTFDLRVYKGTTLLKEGKDYSVKYVNNKNAWEGPEICDTDKAEKQPRVILSGKGAYKAIFENYANDYADTLKFKINRINFEHNEDVYVTNESALYKSGKKYKPIPAVTLNGKKLKNKTDYTIKYLSGDSVVSEYTAPGTYSVLVTGCGRYKGTLKSTFTLSDSEGTVLMSQASVKGVEKKVSYTGTAITPEELMGSDFSVKAKVNGASTELVRNKDYEIILKDNTEIGTGIMIIAAKAGNDKHLVGEKTVKFKITGNVLSKTSIMLKADEDDSRATTVYTYTGNSIKPTVFVSTKGSNSKRLVENRDYTLEFQKNVTVGTATVYIRGINSYSGTVKKRFKIKPVNFMIESKIDDSGNAVIKAVQIGEPYKVENTKKYETRIKVTFNGRVITEGRDYTLTFRNNTENSTKTPEVVIRGKGNFTKNFRLPVTLF